MALLLLKKWHVNSSVLALAWFATSSMKIKAFNINIGQLNLTLNYYVCKTKIEH